MIIVTPEERMFRLHASPRCRRSCRISTATYIRFRAFPSSLVIASRNGFQDDYECLSKDLEGSNYYLFESANIFFIVETCVHLRLRPYCICGGQKKALGKVKNLGIGGDVSSFHHVCSCRVQGAIFNLKLGPKVPFHIRVNALLRITQQVYATQVTLWCRVPLEKLTVPQIVKKLRAFHLTCSFITMFSAACHLCLSKQN